MCKYGADFRWDPPELSGKIWFYYIIITHKQKYCTSEVYTLEQNIRPAVRYLATINLYVSGSANCSTVKIKTNKNSDTWINQ